MRVNGGRRGGEGGSIKSLSMPNMALERMARIECLRQTCDDGEGHWFGPSLGFAFTCNGKLQELELPSTTTCFLTGKKRAGRVLCEITPRDTRE